MLKGLVLAGGKGFRLKPTTDALPKPLIPVANRPVLEYPLRKLADAGIRDIGVVISPQGKEPIISAFGDGSALGIHLTYIVQGTPLGIAHAVMTARNFLQDSPFILILGDNLVQGSITPFTEDFSRGTSEALIMLKEVADPRAFGVAKLDTTGCVVRLVEKPKEPESNLAVMGIYLFTAAIHEAIQQIRPSWRGELEITDAIQKLVDSGKTVKGRIFRGWWYDTGDRKNLLESNRTLLIELLKTSVQGQVDSSTRLTGKVEIQRGTVIENSTIRGPVSIAEDCRITEATIGPYASIGKGTVVVDGACIEDSIVMGRSSVSGAHLKDGVVGPGSLIRKPRGVEIVGLLTGEHAVIE